MSLPDNEVLGNRNVFVCVVTRTPSSWNSTNSAQNYELGLPKVSEPMLLKTLCDSYGSSHFYKEAKALGQTLPETTQLINGNSELNTDLL